MPAPPIDEESIFSAALECPSAERRAAYLEGDGTKIAYTTATLSIATIKPDGTGVKVVLAKTSAWSFYSPHWSPTGGHIACTGQANSGSPPNLEVFRVSAKGTNAANLTNTPAPLNEYMHFFGGGGWR